MFEFEPRIQVSWRSHGGPEKAFRGRGIKLLKKDHY